MIIIKVVHREVYRTCHSKSSGFRPYNEFEHQTNRLATGNLEGLEKEIVIYEKDLLTSTVAISGSVKRFGSRKTSPHIGPIGTDKVIAVGPVQKGS